MKDCPGGGRSLRQVAATETVEGGAGEIVAEFVAAVGRIENPFWEGRGAAAGKQQGQELALTLAFRTVAEENFPGIEGGDLAAQGIEVGQLSGTELAGGDIEDRYSETFPFPGGNGEKEVVLGRRQRLAIDDQSGSDDVLRRSRPGRSCARCGGGRFVAGANLRRPSRDLPRRRRQ